MDYFIFKESSTRTKSSDLLVKEAAYVRPLKYTISFLKVVIPLIFPKVDIRSIVVPYSSVHAINSHYCNGNKGEYRVCLFVKHRLKVFVLFLYTFLAVMFYLKAFFHFVWEKQGIFTKTTPFEVCFCHSPFPVKL